MPYNYWIHERDIRCNNYLPAFRPCPEFVSRSTAAGTVGYWAFLTGKRVIYFGRKGEQHIEEFPRANP